MITGTVSRFRRYPELGVVSLLVVILLLFVDLLKVDLWVVALLYRKDTLEWTFASIALVDGLNQYFDTVFVIAGACASLVCILVSCFNHSSLQWRRVGIFLLLSLGIGPGLVVNGFLKNVWGRPRPADTVQFGGSEDFRRVTNPGAGGAKERGGAGRSFPSGHAAVAFWSTALFFVARYLLPQRALLTLGLALGLGLLVGMARVLAGRHYPSDVLWAGVIVFSINGLIAYLWLQLPRSPAHAGEVA
jgi:membrane-associated PAP2 superfamily phosphatase